MQERFPLLFNIPSSHKEVGEVDKQKLRTFFSFYP